MNDEELSQSAEARLRRAKEAYKEWQQLDRNAHSGGGTTASYWQEQLEKELGV